MRRAALGMTAGLALAGCIPQVDPPPYREPPPAPLVSRDDPQAAAEPELAPVPAPPPEHPPEPEDLPPSAAYPAPGIDQSPLAPEPPVAAPPPAERDVTVRRSRPAVSALPAPRPAWEARPVTPDAPVLPDRRYTVRPGDTLARIAARTGASEEAIARANRLQPPDMVHAGDQLAIPGGRYHLVRPGESGIAIARAYGVPWSRIIAANDLAEPYALRAGQRVLIPATPAGTTHLAERAAAFTLDVDDILTGGEPAARPDQAPAAPAPTARRKLPSTAVVAAPARLRGAFLWPADGPVVDRFARTGAERNGIAIAVPLRTPVHATADGVVAYAGSGIPALGGLVIIRHGDGWVSVYGHAAKLLVRRGQAVTRGQTIALSGDTGQVSRPELHFELRRGRTPVDPQAEVPQS